MGEVQNVAVLVFVSTLEQDLVDYCVRFFFILKKKINTFEKRFRVNNPFKF